MAELNQVKSVIKQEGNEVQVSIPMVGFPEGFELHPGDKVTVLYEDGSPVARPLIHMKDVGEPAADKSALEASTSSEFALEANSVVDTGGESDRLEAFIIDSDSDRERAVAVLPRPQN
jgi:hypothetical protein